jgi:hypothetical protein
MRRGWMRVSGWALATGAMVGLSWYGVVSVLHPRSVTSRAEYASDGLPADPPVAVESATGSAVPRPSVSTVTASASASPSRSAVPTPGPTLRGTPTRPAPTTAPAGVIRAYRVTGGQAVFELGATSATLVSTTPAPGWSGQVWRETDWIRVVFKQDDQGSDQQTAVSVITCSWNGHPPQVQTYTS